MKNPDEPIRIITADWVPATKNADQVLAKVAKALDGSRMYGGARYHGHWVWLLQPKRRSVVEAAIIQACK